MTTCPNCGSLVEEPGRYLCDNRCETEHAANVARALPAATREG